MIPVLGIIFVPPWLFALIWVVVIIRGITWLKANWQTREDAEYNRRKYAEFSAWNDKLRSAQQLQDQQEREFARQFDEEVDQDIARRFGSIDSPEYLALDPQQRKMIRQVAADHVLKERNRAHNQPSHVPKEPHKARKKSSHVPKERNGARNQSSGRY